MRITLTGATGFIGRKLVERYARDGHQLTTTARKRPEWLPADAGFYAWDALNAEFPEETLKDCEAVIHLAGEPVAQRWSPDVKRGIRDSRLNGTRRLVEALSTVSRRPGVLVSASAVGYYGDRGDDALSEES